jgi:outer membrane protein OmpA-like peptidoglycan-associated protein
MHKGLLGREAQSLAPQAFAIADQELKLARQAESSGDTLTAELHADRSLASYAHAVALARLARATAEEASANEARGSASELAQRYAAQRKAIDREAEDLDKQLRIARESQLPAPSGAADPEREKARVVAAQALVTQARLLCSASRLVSPQAQGLADAETAVTSLEKQLDSGAKAAAPIDPAARARAACLTVLTKARRAAVADADPSDPLLAELSQASASGDKKRLELSPARDERGVVVTLRGAFQGTALTPEAEATLKDLGRVAAAHPGFGVQVVVHDAQPPSGAEAAANGKRGDALKKVLTDGGAAADKIKVEQAGARAPVIDPRDTKHQGRNARVEVVFVTKSRD